MRLREQIDKMKNSGYMLHPKILQIEITNRCPFNCPQCYKDINNIREMDWTLLQDIVQDAFRTGIKSIMINGGEPLLYSHFSDLVALLTSLGIHSYCFTSGYGISDQFIDEMKDKSIFLSISLNGSTEEINALSRDGYAYGMQALRRLKSKGMRFGINWVARADNVSDFPNMLTLCENFGAEWINVIANKIGCNGILDSPMSVEDYALLAEYITKYERRNYIRVENCFSLLKVFAGLNVNDSIKGCHAAISTCSIDMDGNYLPCSHLLYKEKFDSISDYWRNSKILEQLRKMKCQNKTYCKECVYSSKCRFCPAVSKATHDDFTTGYEQCPIRRVE